jgi:hypothetical protein
MQSNLAVNRKKQNSFYLLIGIVGVAAVFIGFFTTYIRPFVSQQFTAPAIVHIHGALSFSWILLFLVQTLVIKFRKFPWHRRLGYAGVVIAIGVVLTLPWVGKFQVDKDLARGLGDTAVSAIVGIMTTSIMFFGFVAAGVRFRRRPKIHKRLMLLATIIILWPAWFRFRHYFPSVPRPDIWFGVVLADSLILLAWMADGITYRKIHPVLLLGGMFIIAENTAEVLLFDTEPWRNLAKWIYALIG